ncbi:biosynthetic arginine decarboxylase [Thiohalophilus sp.]|uniref:biosynthetic arginine decarboxylase n=1 Tax=Thiohalophilus sp. TaxID=3028392 RepID=UPI0039771D05
MSDWNRQQALATYSVVYWGEGYFGINEQGHMLAHPDRQAHNRGIDLYQLATRAVREHSVTLPIVVRFTDILNNRLDTLCQSFHQAMASDAYQGKYTAVYPVKVNQQASVIRQLVEHGQERVGLEAGSKPELMAVLGLSHPGGVIVCNGYKDREYIRLALIGRKLGHQVYIVIEKHSELELVISESRALGITPLLGVRVRLASIGEGKWQNTGGEKAKFGLSAAQVIWVIERLREAGMSDSLQMLHFHLGSQIANIRDIQRGMLECARYFVELHRMGINIRCVDVGGGLGVDYEGSRSRSFCSMNYSVQSYTNNIVHVLWEACEEHGLAHPDIFTESGRAMTAHHAVLITNIIDTEQVPDASAMLEPQSDDPLVLQDMWQCYEAVQNETSSRAAMEIYHDIKHWLSEVQSMYTHGVLTLDQRAYAEELYYVICQRVHELLSASNRVHREVLDELHDKLADKYFANFSLFQSIPDVWAIDQIFPVVPLHRLDEKPTRRGVIEDITCDSDGRIDYYVDGEGVESSLPLHPLKSGEPYLIGIFMVGAYQEILGDMHNLFGDTDSINVVLDNDGNHQIEQVLYGDTVDSVLDYVHIRADLLLDSYQKKLAQADLDESESREYLSQLESGLKGYTYLEDE